MGFSKPKIPKPKPPANQPILARDEVQPLDNIPFGAGTLITTSASGLKRKANTQRTSLIGG